MLLFREDDDAVVSRQHNVGFAADRITTQSVDLAAGGAGDGLSKRWVRSAYLIA